MGEPVELTPDRIVAVALPSPAPPIGVTPPVPDAAVVLPTPGVPGPQGEEGPSAYQVAVRNGYDGSEEEWLSSLIGAGVNLSDYAEKVYVNSALQTHIESEEPHPAYDNIVDLATFVRNRLV